MNWRQLIGLPESRARDLDAANQRDIRLVEWMHDDQHFGQTVNHLRLEWLSAASAAIDAISGTIGSLPAFVYRKGTDGRAEDNDHPLARLIRNGPNRWQTWPDFIQWFAAQALRHGNGLAEIVTDGNGTITELVPISWDVVSAKVLPNGRLVYDFTDKLTSDRRRLLDDNALHLRDRSDDGFLGRARHERSHPVIAAALALTEYSGNTFRNGAYPSGSVSVEGKLSDVARKLLKEQFAELFSGPSKAGKVLVLDQGIKFDSVQNSPEDMELLAARRFAIEEAARLYQVPPPIIGDLSHGTFTNSETLIRFFAQSTLTTWCRKIEAEIHRSIFSTPDKGTHEFVLDLSGLLRGDPETRWKSHEIALRNRVLTPNEIRDLEGWNRRAGGDEFPPAAGAAP